MFLFLREFRVSSSIFTHCFFSLFFAIRLFPSISVPLIHYLFYVSLLIYLFIQLSSFSYSYSPSFSIHSFFLLSVAPSGPRFLHSFHLSPLYLLLPLFMSFLSLLHPFLTHVTCSILPPPVLHSVLRHLLVLLLHLLLVPFTHSPQASLLFYCVTIPHPLLSTHSPFLSCLLLLLRGV